MLKHGGRIPPGLGLRQWAASCQPADATAGFLVLAPWPSFLFQDESSAHKHFSFAAGPHLLTVEEAPRKTCTPCGMAASHRSLCYSLLASHILLK